MSRAAKVTRYSEYFISCRDHCALKWLRWVACEGGDLLEAVLRLAHRRLFQGAPPDKKTARKPQVDQIPGYSDTSCTRENKEEWLDSFQLVIILARSSDRPTAKRSSITSQGQSLRRVNGPKDGVNAATIIQFDNSTCTADQQLRGRSADAGFPVRMQLGSLALFLAPAPLAPRALAASAYTTSAHQRLYDTRSPALASTCCIPPFGYWRRDGYTVRQQAGYTIAPCPPISRDNELGKCRWLDAMRSSKRLAPPPASDSTARALWDQVKSTSKPFPHPRRQLPDFHGGAPSAQSPTLLVSIDSLTLYARRSAGTSLRSERMPTSRLSS
ncbi:hypothetical protein PENSPDRAFT_671866 [Peniophora sp. CONT]|nr:hypothetical protein PENSPDRAFT_671866 [Peniophora sp. CONT]